MAATFGEDPAVVTWWGAPVECVSALARLERDAALDRRGLAAALARLRSAAAGWAEVPATPTVREQAMRLVRVHPLRAADALHLAAAIVAADFQPTSLEFVTLDIRLGTAAEREGFRVIGLRED
jgi:uncharacterized protein